MECPSCGALYKKRSKNCPECGAIQNKTSAKSRQQPQPNQAAVIVETPPIVTSQRKRATTTSSLIAQTPLTETSYPERATPNPTLIEQTRPAETSHPERGTPTPSLIEFPGVNKSAMPQWRKELVERVREVQERRAREETLDSAETDPRVDENAPTTSPLLELLPQAEVPPLNPLVAAALRRIERAHAQSQGSGNAAVATAVMCEDQAEPGLNDPSANGSKELENAQHESTHSERAHNLAVVPKRAVSNPEISEVRRKPKRLIGGDLNDPALNYLDSIPTAIQVDKGKYYSAPVILRMLSALVDLMIVCFFSFPLLALTELTNLEWHNARVIGFLVISFAVVGFLYMTVSTAFTGRTVGMKLFSLRVVDARTGLIPTGNQAAGRALVYLLSLASAGIALIYTFIDSEKHTIHDRFTRTAVIRV